MSIGTIENPPQFLASLGGLHDVRIDKILIDTDDQTLELILNDINANFTELPEYPGRKPVKLIFNKVTVLFVDVDTDEGVRISNAEVVSEAPEMRLDIELNLGGGSVSEGRPKITAKFRSLQIQDAVGAEQ